MLQRFLENARTKFIHDIIYGARGHFFVTLFAAWILLLPVFIRTTCWQDTLFLSVLCGWWIPFAVIAWIGGSVRRAVSLKFSSVVGLVSSALCLSLLFLTKIGRAAIITIPPFPGAILIFASSIPAFASAAAAWSFSRYRREFNLFIGAVSIFESCTKCNYPKVLESSKCPECGLLYENAGARNLITAGGTDQGRMTCATDLAESAE